jgi:hypothetical protein
MPRTIFLYAFLASLLITGCGSSATLGPLNTPAAEQSASSLPALDGEWMIKLTQSGGFMGLSRSIEISSGGKFTIMDEKINKKVTGEFPADELSAINKLVSSSKYIAPAKSDGMSCADCFIYDLEIQGNGEKFTAQLNDISLPNSGLESLVTHLRGLIETNLK